jgi:hypothetical protein
MDLKSFVIEIFQKILAAMLIGPICLGYLLYGCLIVILMGIGIYLIFWLGGVLHFLIMKTGLYLLWGVLP